MGVDRDPLDGHSRVGNPPDRNAANESLADKSLADKSPVAEFRFYAELNDFLGTKPAGERVTTYAYRGHPSVKDAIEALGVPHTEVDLILANGETVDFDYHLRPGDRIAVYPVFESLDISSLVRLRGAAALRRPLRRTAFVLDVHLGKLARLLRMLGFDARYRNDYEDKEIVDIARQERRIILTRDRGLLMRGAVTHGYWVRSMAPVAQAREVVRRFDLREQVQPFTRCLRCNGTLEPVPAEVVRDRVPPQAAAWCAERGICDYHRCTRCGQVYWPGTHYERMQRTVARILADPRNTGARGVH
jgi:uncharacterized protein with PIN domain